MDTDYIQENAKERNRLFTLIAGLMYPDLQRPVGHDWTVATKLLHLAFWDRYSLELLRRWKTETPSMSTLDVDAVNESVKALSRAIPYQAISTVVHDAAEAVDREVECVTPDLRTAILATERERILKRFIHRRDHLNQIEIALAQT